jgi:hypothetical protein
MTVAMASPFSSHSSSIANLSKVTSLTAVSAPAAATAHSVPAGTLPPGTHLTVGKHNVTIDRWLSEGTTHQQCPQQTLQGPFADCAQVALHMSMSCG